MTRAIAPNHLNEPMTAKPLRHIPDTPENMAEPCSTPPKKPDERQYLKDYKASKQG